MNRPQRTSRSWLYTVVLAIGLVAIVTVSASALYITAGGNLLGLGAGAFGVEPAPDPATATLQRARQAAWSGRSEDAIAAYDSVIAALPGDRAVAAERARVLGWAERYAEAADALAALPGEPADPTGAETAVQRARFLWWAGRAREADSLLSVVRAEHPGLAEAAELQDLIRPAVEPVLDVATRWVAERPDDPASNLWLARALVADGRAAESLGHYRVAMGEPGTLDPDVLMEAAGVALGVDSLALAGQLLSRYLRDVDPPDVETRLRLARAYAWSGRYTAADQQYRIVLAQAPDRAIHLELTRMLAGAGRYDDAAVELTLLLARQETVPLLTELARVLALAERYGEAADVLGRVLARRPEDHAARVDRARFLWWAGRIEAADAELDHVLAAPREPSVPSEVLADASALRAELRAGIDPSIELAARWLAAEDSPANRLHLARALVKAERYGAAVEHYRAGLGDGADPDLVIEAADVATEADSLDAVIGILERHLAAAPGADPSMRLRLARAHAWAGHHDRAARAYADYLATRPADVDARFERGRLLTWGDSAGWSDARSELERVVAAEPDRAEAFKLLGDLARWTGDADAALAHYRRAEAAAGPDPALESLDDGIRLALEMKASELAQPDATRIAWAAGFDAFTDTEGFDWIGSSVRRDWRVGERQLWTRLGQGYSRGRPLVGAELGAVGLSATVGGRMPLTPRFSALAELGAMSFEDIDAFVTWGAGVEYGGVRADAGAAGADAGPPRDPRVTGRLWYGRSPAVRDAATMAALQAGAVMDRLQLTAERAAGPWLMATDLQLQRFSADVGDADRYAGMVRVDRELGASGMAVGALVRGVAASERAPVLTDWGRLYWTPDHYIAPALSVRYATPVGEGWWLGLRASPGVAFIDEGDDGPARYDRNRTAILEAGASVGYRQGPWTVDVSGDWGGAIPDGYNASSLRFQLSRFGGLR